MGSCVNDCRLGAPCSLGNLSLRRCHLCRLLRMRTKEISRGSQLIRHCGCLHFRQESISHRTQMPPCKDQFWYFGSVYFDVMWNWVLETVLTSLRFLNRLAVMWRCQSCAAFKKRYTSLLHLYVQVCYEISIFFFSCTMTSLSDFPHLRRWLLFAMQTKEYTYSVIPFFR